MTALLGRFMVSIAIRRPVKIAAGISPIEAVRFAGSQSGNAHTHKKNMPEWHAWYADADDQLWQIDMIHMPKGSAIL